ncbi:MAG TPA: amino acid ABC transporter permease [Verrucomicrobiota bacterium]|nr:amino acid ABC transporter permease [Verrucomicrobiota bacterium]
MPAAGDVPDRLAPQVVAWGLLLLLLAGLFTAAFLALDYRWNWAAVWRYRTSLFRGWLLTLGLSLAALLLSGLLGALAALAAQSRLRLPRAAARLYVELIRGTPLLVQILVFFYVVADAAGIGNRHLAGVLILAVFSGAYLAEIFRAGLESVGRSQWETARALGLTPAQTYRLVVLPQALRQMLPPLAGQWVSLIKDSSLLSVIGLQEFTLAARDVNAQTYSTLEAYLPLAAGYLLLTLPLSLWARRLERRTGFET